MNHKTCLLFLMAFLFVNGSFNMVSAQGSLVKQWDYRYGGTANDKIYAFIKTPDNGFMLGGFTVSDSGGDISQITKGSYDFWIVKLNAFGLKEWDKRYGGDQADILATITPTSDGGYLLGGSSFSGIGGDKSQPCWGSDDYWIMKIDSSGQKIWDKRFGGIYDDALASVCKTSDGGFLLGGYSNSPSGGDKTDSTWSFLMFDYWLVKIDANGNMQWNKRYGGYGNESLTQMEQTTDNGFLLAGFSNSDIGGNKTQQSRGGYDYWIMKTDSMGTIMWDKTLGGDQDDELMSFARAANGDYVLAGWSYSNVSGEKSEPSKGISDYWIIKIDAAGNKLWDKDFGGANTDDDLGNIIKTSDGGFIIPTTSYSNISGDKTENNMGIEQTWLIKTDQNGNLEWDKTIFTDGHDEGCFILETNENCYVLANRCNAGIGGYKTQPNWDSSPQPMTTYDFWILNLCDSAVTTPVSETNSMNAVTLFPNPFTNEISISWNNTIANTTVYDVHGKTVFSSTLLNQKKKSQKLDLSFLDSGIYFLDVKTNDGRFTQKIIKQ